MQPVGYIIGNILWISIGSSFNPSVPNKYLQASWSSGVYTNEIWTQAEILDKYPNAKPVKSLLDIKEIYQSN